MGKGAGTAIIHRVLDRGPEGLTMIGDNNDHRDPWILAAAAGGLATYMFAVKEPKPDQIGRPASRPRIRSRNPIG